MQPIYTGISAQRKGNSIELTATAPEGVEKRLILPSEDIRAIYSFSAAQFMEQVSDSEKELWRLFNCVESIRLTDEG